MDKHTFQQFFNVLEMVFVCFRFVTVKFNQSAVNVNHWSKAHACQQFQHIQQTVTAHNTKMISSSQLTNNNGCQVNCTLHAIFISHHKLLSTSTHAINN